MELRKRKRVPWIRNEEDSLTGHEIEIRQKGELIKEETLFLPKLARFNLPKVQWPKEGSYTRILDSLNPEQMDFIHHVWRQLKERKDPFHYFLSGQAGSGKSHIVQALSKLCAILSWFESRRERKCVRKKTDPCVLVLAPTEYTASQINGLTPYDALAIPRSKLHGTLPELSEIIVEYLQENLKNVRLIVIDEISSMSMDLFSHINARLKQIFCCSDEFGNLPVIVVGDVKQFSPSPETGGLWSKFQLYELKINMRQTNEKLLSVLSSLRQGELNNQIVEVLNSRNVLSSKFKKYHTLTLPLDSVFLCNDKETADHYNHIRLQALCKEYFTSDAFDTVTGSDNKDALLLLEKFHARQPILDIQGLRSKLELAAFGRYMLSHDVDPSDGLVKGLTGFLFGVQFSCGESVDVLWMLFDRQSYETIGLKTREKFLQFDKKVNSCTKDANLRYADKSSKLVPIVRISVDLRDNFVHNLKVTRSQFPVVPAEALTMEEFQGKSFSNAFIPLMKGKKMSTEYLYAAASRVEHLRGLYLIGELSENYSGSNNGRCKKQAPCFPPLELEISQGHFVESFSFYFHNVDQRKPFILPHRSEPRHMLANPMLEHHDILIFVGCGIEKLFSKSSDDVFPNAELRYENGRHAQIFPNLLLFSKSQVHFMMKTYSNKRNGPLSFYRFRIFPNLLLITGYAHSAYQPVELIRSLKLCLRNVSKRENIIFIFSRQSNNGDCIFKSAMALANLRPVLFSVKLNENGVRGITVIYSNIQNYNAQTQPCFHSYSSCDPVFFQTQDFVSLRKEITNSVAGLVNLRHCRPFSSNPKVGDPIQREIKESKKKFVIPTKLSPAVMEPEEEFELKKRPEETEILIDSSEKLGKQMKVSAVEGPSVSGESVDKLSDEFEELSEDAEILSERNKRKTPHVILPHAAPALYVTKQCLRQMEDSRNGGIIPVEGYSGEKPELKERPEGTEILIGSLEKPGKQMEVLPVEGSSVSGGSVKEVSNEFEGLDEYAEILSELLSVVPEQKGCSMQVNTITKLSDATVKDSVDVCEEVNAAIEILDSVSSEI